MNVVESAKAVFVSVAALVRVTCVVELLDVCWMLGAVVHGQQGNSSESEGPESSPKGMRTRYSTLPENTW